MESSQLQRCPPGDCKRQELTGAIFIGKKQPLAKRSLQRMRVHVTDRERLTPSLGFAHGDVVEPDQVFVGHP